MGRYTPKEYKCRECGETVEREPYETFYGITQYFQLPNICLFCVRRLANSCFYCSRTYGAFENWYTITNTSYTACSKCFADRKRTFADINKGFEHSIADEILDPDYKHRFNSKEKDKDEVPKSLREMLWHYHQSQGG
jgi:hypothetical protein